MTLYSRLFLYTCSNETSLLLEALRCLDLSIILSVFDKAIYPVVTVFTYCTISRSHQLFQCQGPF